MGHCSRTELQFKDTSSSRLSPSRLPNCLFVFESLKSDEKLKKKNYLRRTAVIQGHDFPLPDWCSTKKFPIEPPRNSGTLRFFKERHSKAQLDHESDVYIQHRYSSICKTRTSLHAQESETSLFMQIATIRVGLLKRPSSQFLILRKKVFFLCGVMICVDLCRQGYRALSEQFRPM